MFFIKIKANMESLKNLQSISVIDFFNSNFMFLHIAHPDIIQQLYCKSTICLL